MSIEQINNSTGTVQYLHHDQAGSTRLITGEKGEVTGSSTYGPYGETTGHTGTATTPLGYDAQYTSPDTGLIYVRARTYDPTTAQFLSVDPAVEITEEPYNYAFMIRSTWEDRSGLEREIAIPCGRAITLAARVQTVRRSASVWSVSESRAMTGHPLVPVALRYARSC
jgi:RHS repeat-associated protein